MLDLRLSRARYLALFSGVYLAMFLIRVAFGVVTITFGRYMTNVDDFVYGLIVAAAPFCELLTVPFVGVFVDRYGRKGVLLAGLALGAFSLYGLALTDNVFALGLVNGIHGAAAALILVTTLAIIASYAAPDKRGREMGLFNFVNMFGWFFGFALGSALLDLFETDLRYTFVIAGALATFGLAYSNYTVREPERKVEPEGKPDLRKLYAVARKPGILLLSISWFFVYVFVGALITFFSRFTTSEEGLGFAGGSVALSLLGMGVFFMASQLLFGRLSDKYGREPFMIVGAMGFLGFMLTIALGVFGAPAQADPRVVFAHVFEQGILLAIFAFCTLAFAPAALAALADEATSHTEGTTMSVYSLVLNLGMITGPPLMGLASDLGSGRGVLLLLIGISVGLLASVIVRTGYVRNRPDAKARTPLTARPPP